MQHVLHSLCLVTRRGEGRTHEQRRKKMKKRKKKMSIANQSHQLATDSDLRTTGRCASLLLSQFSLRSFPALLQHGPVSCPELFVQHLLHDQVTMDVHWEMQDSLLTLPADDLLCGSWNKQPFWTQRGLPAQTGTGTPFKERLQTGKTQHLRKGRPRRYNNDNNAQDTERCMMDFSLQFPRATSASTERLLDVDVPDCRIEDNKK